MAGKPSQDFWNQEIDRLAAELGQPLAEATLLGVDEGIALLNLGSIVLDTGLINDAALAWAAQYTYELVSGITATTATAIGDLVAEWIASGEPIRALELALANDPSLAYMLGPGRARLIAMTETTRAFASGNFISWVKSGYVVGTRWMNVEDPKVDEICQINSDAGVVPLGEPFPSGDLYAPAHPGCRCYMQPVTKKEV